VIQYEQARDERGLTVAEFEDELGLPPYSVYPEAKNAKPSDLGYYMYSNGHHGALPGSYVGVKPNTSVGYFPKVAGKQAEEGGHGWKKHRGFIMPKS
jgi:hypothetical protein